MTTKFINDTNLALYLEISSGSDAAYDELKRKLDVETDQATSYFSKLDVKDIEASLADDPVDNK